MENENATNPTTAAESQGGPSKFCASCGAQLHIQAEICPKCGVRQQPVNAPQGAAASAEPRQAAGVKYCATCGASLNPAAEICPKCGVRQAPPPHAGQGPGANPAQRGGAFFSEMTQEIRNMGFLAWLKKMTSSNGRASRKEFIAVVVICNVLVFIITFIATQLGIPAIIILSNIFVFLLSAIIIFCMPRRLHDMNLPGWITVIILVLLLFLWGASMEYGAASFYVPWAVIMIALAAIPGTAGRNKYGEPPK